MLVKKQIFVIKKIHSISTYPQVEFLQKYQPLVIPFNKKIEIKIKRNTYKTIFTYYLNIVKQVFKIKLKKTYEVKITISKPIPTIRKKRVKYTQKTPHRNCRLQPHYQQRCGIVRCL